MTSSACYDVGDQKAHVTEPGQAETQTIPVASNRREQSKYVLVNKYVNELRECWFLPHLQYETSAKISVIDGIKAS